jgi:hypothetical protein
LGDTVSILVAVALYWLVLSVAVGLGWSASLAVARWRRERSDDQPDDDWPPWM